MSWRRWKLIFKFPNARQKPQHFGAMDAKAMLSQGGEYERELQRKLKEELTELAQKEDAEQAKAVKKRETAVKVKEAANRAKDRVETAVESD